MQDEIDNLIKQEDIKKLKNESKFLKKITDTGSVSLEKLVVKMSNKNWPKTIALQSQLHMQEKDGKNLKK